MKHTIYISDCCNAKAKPDTLIKTKKTFYVCYHCGKKCSVTTITLTPDSEITEVLNYYKGVNMGEDEYTDEYKEKLINSIAEQLKIPLDEK